MIISIQQPEFFPWLGFFDKMGKVDKVVFLDSVQFKKRYFENRNKLRTYQGWSWIAAPVVTKGKYRQKIMDVRIDGTQPWQRKIVNTLSMNYRKAPFWRSGGQELCDLVSKEYHRLVDFNLAIILFFAKKLDIEREWCMASDLDIETTGNELIRDICNKLGADRYL